MRAAYAKHIDFVRDVGRSAGCIICADTTNIEAAHLRWSDASVGRINPGKGRKSDPWVIPLCSECHRLQHAYGNEWKFWRDRNINPNPTAAYLWLNTGNHEAGCKIIEALRFEVIEPGGCAPPVLASRT